MAVPIAFAVVDNVRRQPRVLHCWSALVIASLLGFLAVLCTQIIQWHVLVADRAGILRAFALTSLLLAAYLVVLEMDVRSRTVLVAGVISIGACHAFVAAVFSLTGHERLWFESKQAGIGSATGFFANRDHLAAFLALSLCVASGWMVSESLRGPPGNSAGGWLRRLPALLLSARAVVRIAMVVTVIALVMTRSRMGNAAFVTAFAVALGVLLTLQRRWSGGVAVFAISVALIDIGLVGANFGLDRVIDRVARTDLGVELRDEATRDGLMVVVQSAWLGVGAGNWRFVVPAVARGDVGVEFTHAHNDYVQILAEYGVIGSAGFVLLGAAGLAAALAGLRSGDPARVGHAFAALMAWLYMAQHALVDFNLQVPVNVLLLVVVLGLAMPGPGRGRRRRDGFPADP